MAELPVSVVYAEPDQQWHVELQVAAGTTVAQLLARLPAQRPWSDLDLSMVPLGVYGEVVERDRVLLAHDRVEIYRSLITDPKTARRQRAAASGAADAGR